MAADSLFANVTSLTHFEDTNGSTTVTDVLGGTWSAMSGGPTISTAQYKWSTSSARLTGAGTITGPTGVAAFGTQDLCIEMWARADAGAGTSRCLFARGSGTTSLELWINSGGSLVVYGNNSALISVAGPASIVTADVWNHYGLTRYGNVWTCWFNGVAHSTVTYSGSLATTGTWDVGGPGAINRWIGYIDDFRLTIGNARYTAAFTPPTEAFGDSIYGNGGPLTCPMPTLSASGVSIIPTADFAGVMGSPTFSGYGGANADLSMPMATVAIVTGARGAVTMPMPYTTSVGHASTGDAAFILTMPSLEAVGYGGANADLTTSAYDATGTGTVTIWGHGTAELPAMTVSATGTVSTTGSGSPFLSMPMATLVGYGGALCSITLTGGYTTQATGLVGSVGNAAATLPLFELTATGTAQNHGSAEITMPALVATPSGTAYLILPGFTLTAIGTATVAVTYEAYALNLNHKEEPRKQPVDELTRYTNYPFDRIVRYKNSYYGMNSTGLYLLEGTTDAGEEIAWDFKTAMSDFGTTQNKTVEVAYFGGRMGPAATITLHVGEKGDEIYNYTTPRGAFVQNYRQAFGRGVKSRYYALEAAGSGDLTLDSITLNVATLARKV